MRFQPASRRGRAKPRRSLGGRPGERGHGERRCAHLRTRHAGRPLRRRLDPMSARVDVGPAMRRVRASRSPASTATGPARRPPPCRTAFVPARPGCGCSSSDRARFRRPRPSTTRRTSSRRSRRAASELLARTPRLTAQYRHHRETAANRSRRYRRRAPQSDGPGGPTWTVRGPVLNERGVAAINSRAGGGPHDDPLTGTDPETGLGDPDRQGQAGDVGGAGD